ncbi:MAG: MTAP family purine nucleoside phosphorylase [Sphaerochaeta sp.]
MKAIIGGTGVDTLEGIDSKREVVATPYGTVELFVGKGKDAALVFLPRHGSTHSAPPHLINYRANIKALQMLGVTHAISIYAVGSITEKLPPGKVGLVSDFIDLSSGREHTFFTGGEQQVVHTAMDECFDAGLRQRILREDGSLLDAGVYICTNGPRLETPAEIRYLRGIGGDTVGMTLATEVSLLREAQIATLALAYSINWAAGIDNGSVTFITDEQIAALKKRMTELCRNTLQASSSR